MRTKINEETDSRVVIIKDTGEYCFQIAMMMFISLIAFVIYGWKSLLFLLLLFFGYIILFGRPVRESVTLDKDSQKAIIKKDYKILNKIQEIPFSEVEEIEIKRYKGDDETETPDLWGVSIFYWADDEYSANPVKFRNNLDIYWSDNKEDAESLANRLSRISNKTLIGLV